MTYRIAINGYGRIGRCVLRALYESPHCDGLQLVAINEPADLETIVHLTKYDSTHGRFAGQVEALGDGLQVNGDDIRVTHETELENLVWSELGVDLVLECSGVFSDRAAGEQHLKQGAKRVLFSHPSEPDVDATIVFGINHQSLTPEDRIISNASCTTNCIIPVIQCLGDAIGIESGHITTIHSAMNDQPVIDAYHHTDLRRTRSASSSIIPVETGLAKGIARILPQYTDKFIATAMRVPTVNVSIMDLTMLMSRDTTIEEVNKILQSCASGHMAGIMGYTDELLASCDFNHDPRSSIVDGSQTGVSDRRLVKVMAWFDNEWGFANRMLDVACKLKNLSN